MKHLLIIAFILLQFSFSYSQRSGGGGQRGGGQRGGQSGQNSPTQNDEKKALEIININKASGLITYDIAEVIKESKVKKAADKEVMTQLISEYNKEIQEIKKVNKIKLETIELTTLEKQKIAIEKKDHLQLMKIGKEINEELHPIRMEVMEAEKVLNSKIKTSLSENINKKWTNYFDKQKKSKSTQ